MAGTVDPVGAPGAEPSEPSARSEASVPSTPSEPFVPFRTARLTLRPFEAADAPSVTAYRNDPDVAHYQDWPLPYPPERTEQFIAAAAGRTEPERGEWWAIAVERHGVLAGDVAVHLDETGSVATIGYTLARAHHGAGLAGEAVGAIVDRLFAHTPIHRIQATVDPENIPSIRLLEGLGFLSEGIARRSVEIRGEWLDDARYGVLRDEREAWRTRPRHSPADVRLVEITPDIAPFVRSMLRTFGWQEAFVSPNLRSFADALIPEIVNDAPVVPWFRAVEADGTLVGFVMLAEVTQAHPLPYLWRLMVDKRHQRRGIGSRVLDLVIERVRALGATMLETSWGVGVGSPEPFYLGRGFVPTGEIDDGEVVARLDITS